jgi:hypothetical protein
LDSPWVALERKGNSYVIAASELLKLRRLLGGHPMRDPLAAVNAMRPRRVIETEMPGGALYEPGAETDAEVADAKLVADARIAASQGRDALYGFCKALSKAEYESIRTLHTEELVPLARKKDDLDTRDLQVRLRTQIEGLSAQ